MKLLIITQAIDENNPVMGFFVRWAEEFAKNCEKLTVICLEKGEYDLPDNVRVLSLGKEKNANLRGLRHGFTRIKYIFKFYKYIWQERKNYDSVFVHMNQEYILLGAKLWWLMGKKTILWRNHPIGSFLTNLSVYLSNRVFCTSRYAYVAKFKKTEIMPVGIDTNLFKRNTDIEKIPNSILFLSRISPIKKPDILIDALNLLNKDKIDFNALIVGDSLPKDRQYHKNIENKIKEYGLEDKIKLKSGIKNSETVDFYNKYEIFVNLSPNGMFDKTIFEAMACESLSLVNNLNLKDELDEKFIFEENNFKDLSSKLNNVLNLSASEKEKLGKDLREYAREKHGLNLLVRKII
jgi:glycosyltransferase involved in cell wall biosynthesis